MKKLMWLILASVGVVLIAGVILFFYLENEGWSGKVNKNDLLGGFSNSEQERIESALENTDEYGYSEELPIILSEFELEKAIELCDREVIENAISCFKTLSIEKPENREEICSHISLELCDKPSASLYCAESIDGHKEECLLGIPSFRR
ncbi:hypothetical protein HY450_01445 [Candidatus Pacearchaeota archaeon]|nr:hypothetical protein [Candidatus Pacearchaeota archaeon]